MKKIWTLTLVVTLSLASCVKISEATPAPTRALFVTATLPPTKPGLALPTETATSLPEVSTTTTPGTPAGTESALGCKDAAVLLEDVTVPDNAQMNPGEKFTKTWRFKNSGKCNWNGYTISFVAGDKMETPASAPVPQTAAGQTVDVSVELIAPSIDGAYTGYFELKNANGETLPIGIESTFWVKIRIGNVAAAPVATLASTSSSAASTGVPTVKVSGPASCNYSTSGSYANELAGLINNARTQNGLPALTVNPQLMAAAQAHSIDMACHGLLSHSGSDGSSVHQRVSAAGYSASRSSEIIYGSGYPQTAFDWWMNDQIHRNEILNSNITEMGVGYAYVSGTSHGGYYTVDFAAP